MDLLVAKKSLAEAVAAKLREQISSGFYKVDEKLPIEPELMKSFGVGRSSIREAIKLLTNFGLLRVRQGIGTFVEPESANQEPFCQRIERANVNDLDEVRQLLEMKIAEKAAISRTAKDIETIQGHLKDRLLAADKNLIAECIDADIKFHIAVALATKNDILADLYKATSIHLKKWFISSHPDTRAFRATHHLHERLLQHIIAGDAKKASGTAAKITGHL